MPALWSSASVPAWRAALEAYLDVVECQGVTSLADHDRWYREELPRAITARRTPYVTLAELVRATEWKMARGVWRAPNLVRVKGNAPDLVKDTSADALGKIPHPTAPIATLAALDGVGPATASAIAAAYAPDTYPFFDELVAAQIQGLGKVAWTLGYYARYAAAIRERAERLGDGWSPVMVERALWSHAGGKARVAWR